MAQRMIAIILIIISVVVSYLIFQHVDILNKGGPIIILIMLCSIFGLGTALEKKLQLSRAKSDSEKLLQSIFTSLRSFKIKEALAVCESADNPTARILKSGLLKYDRSKEEIKEAMEDASLFEVPALERNLNALATIAHISPLLGLLGTVTGLVRCFQAIQLKSSSFSPINPGDLAGGIWEALITTVAGLMVAIPMFILYNYLVSRVNGVVIDMEHSATKLINFLAESKRKR